MAELFTVLIPTYDHQDTLYYSVESLLRQTLGDFRAIIVGDGAPERTAQIAKELIRRDQRISYVPNPKGEGNGELYRHQALREAKSKYVAYLGDDDLWLPNHLEILAGKLSNFDFVQTTHASCIQGRRFYVHAGDLNVDYIRKRMANFRWNFFGPTSVGHSLEAYLKLPAGWRPKPVGMLSDLHMWRQWIAQDWVRFNSILTITSLHLASPSRTAMSIAERCEEMKFWLGKIDQPEFANTMEKAQLDSYRGELIENLANQPTQDYYNSQLRIASKLYARSQFSLAIDLLNLVREIQPFHPMALNLLARCLTAMGQLDEAEGVNKLGFQHFPTEPAFWDNAAAIALARMNPQDAIAAADKSISMTQGRADPYLWRSIACGKLERYKQALADIEIAINIGSPKKTWLEHRAKMTALLG
ncbi:MAG: glycosyltransferase [Pseudomonadales bacterium]